jgi:hypothetical protein
MSFSKLRAAIVAIALVLGAGNAKAVPTVGLYLAMDGSGSISNSDFTTQINAYTAALNAVFTANPSLYGQVGIGGSIFGGSITEFFPVTTIGTPADLAALVAAISGLNPGRGGINTNSTAIGDALTAGSNALLAYETSIGSNLKLLIDVTTDGQNNAGSNPVTVGHSLVPSSLDAINCLGIGAQADCSFVSGVGTNYGQVSFANLDTALANKLQTEVIPEPTALALLGVGLLTVGFVRRRSA